jgi:ATP-binding cassette subfamily B protein
LSNESPADFLSSVEILSAFGRKELDTFAASAETHNFQFGDTIVNAGDPGKGLYIVKSGSVRLFTEENGKEISMGVRKQGEIFGEIAALREYRHECSVRSSARTEILVIPQQAFMQALHTNREAASFVTSLIAISSAGGFVSKLFDLRRKMDPAEVAELVRSVGIKRIRAGQTIIEQDNTSDRRLYVVRQGTVKLLRDEKGDQYTLFDLNQGDLFGETACLLKQPQPYRVVAQTDAILLVLPEKTVQFILDRNPKLRETLEQRIEYAERELRRHRKLAELRKRPAIFDFYSRPRMGERLIRRFPLVEQAEEMDCGAACLAMICKHFGIPMTLGKLREMANVTVEGATLDSIARVGESLGFTVRGIQCTYQNLLGFDLPFIVHWEGYHYVVVYGVSKNHVWVADPARGLLKMTVEEFERGWTGTCLLFTPGSDMAQISAQRSPWVRFINYLKPHKKILGYLLMATLVIEVLGIAPPLIVQNILDRVVVHSDASLLSLLIIGLVIVHAFTQITTLVRGFLSSFMVRNLDLTMMSQFFKHTLSLPVAFFNRRRTGDVFARFQENATIRQFLTESTISTMLNVLMVFIYFIVLFMYNVKLTLLLIALIIPMVILTVAVTPRLKNYARRAFETSTDAESVLMETISGAETVKAMGVERPMRLKWENRYAKSLDVQYRSQRFELLVGFVSQVLNAVTTITILWMGATLVLRQELSIGQLIAFNMLMGSVMSPILALIGMWDELHEAGVSMERLGDVLDLDPEQKPSESASRIVLPDLRGDIRCENLYFRYGGKESPYVLENVNFSVKPGQLVAIVGQSGSGKTTLAKLLVGFFPPGDGKIYVDGYDLNLVDKEYYRARIGYVMQNNLLFSGTVSENIAMGESNPDQRGIVEAAKLADAHGFISNLPLGYGQIVGERGVGLSGGQIQRLTIARALYRNPRLLIFDEATSALDTQSESNILVNMRDIIRDRTTFIIAHRLSTVMNADKIIVLYKGSIVEEGSHSELVDKGGMYYQLVQKQMAGVS